MFVTLRAVVVVLMDYLKPEHLGSLGGLNRYKEATHQNVRKAKKQLAALEPYTILRERKKRFARNPVIVLERQWQFQADLMDVSKYSKQNKHKKFCLVVIDCFSRKASCIMIRSKEGAEVLKGMQKAFTELGIPEKIQTDKGR